LVVKKNVVICSPIFKNLNEMIKKLLLAKAFIAFAVFSFAQTNAITFKVDMNKAGKTFTTVYVNGTFNNWTGMANPMTDADSDGIWEATIDIPTSTTNIEYKFTLDGWADQEQFAGGEDCTVTNGGFTNRYLDITGDMTLDAVCFNYCVTCDNVVIKDAVELPISWDEDQDAVDFKLRSFDGAVSTIVESPTDAGNMVMKVEKPATAQQWAGTVIGDGGMNSAIPFDANNNKITVRIWSPAANMPLLLKVEDTSNPGEKFVETQATTTEDGGWQDVTFDFTNPGPNTKTIDYANSYNQLIIFCNFLVDPMGTDYTFYVDDIQFGDAIVKEDPIEVTFQVDMNNYTGTYTNVNLNGTFNNWCGECAVMSDDDMDGVYDITVELEEGEIEYKFTVDGWNGQEEFAGGEPCTKSTDGFTNRVFEVTETATLDVVCWNECTECGAAPVDVTFKVDMNQYEDDFSGVNLNGSFNNWCGECAPMTDDDADGVYELTIALSPEDTVEYKFVIGNWDVQEEFTEGDPCTSTIDGFTNRSYVVGTEAATMEAVCWNSCDLCPSSLNELNGNTFSVSPNPSTGFFNLTFDNEIDGDVVIYNYQGKVVYQNLSNTLTQSIDLSNEPAGIYLIKVMNGNSVGFSQIIIE
jgi:hypothetical protein